MFSSVIKRLHDRRDAAGETGADAGFTLIELMVVLLILAILLAIAIPTFLGVTKSANDRAAQSNLNTALVNAKAAFQTNSQSYAIGYTTNATTYATALVTSLNNAEPSLTFTTGASTSQSTISVYVSADGNGVVLAAQAKGTKNCWYAIDNSAAVTTTTNQIYSGATLPAAQDAAGTWYGKQANTSGLTVPVCNAGVAIGVAATYGPITFQANGFPS
jgi:type IV pilus assembly protein PilA